MRKLRGISYGEALVCEEAIGGSGVKVKQRRETGFYKRLHSMSS